MAYKIAIVDDEQEIAELLRAELDEAGHEVTLHNNATSMLETVRLSNFTSREPSSDNRPGVAAQAKQY